jgi:hypothetical protein
MSTTGQLRVSPSYEPSPRRPRICGGFGTTCGHCLRRSWRLSSQGCSRSFDYRPLVRAAKHYPRVAIGAGGGASIYFTPIEKMLTLPFELPVYVTSPLKDGLPGTTLIGAFFTSMNE